MEIITLTEDSCIARNINFEVEKQKLINNGCVILSEFTHPAVGKMITFQSNKRKCHCPCHIDNSMQHMTACCDNGWIKS
jgi:hypothetical protein